PKYQIPNKSEGPKAGRTETDQGSSTAWGTHVHNLSFDIRPSTPGPLARVLKQRPLRFVDRRSRIQLLVEQAWLNVVVVLVLVAGVLDDVAADLMEENLADGDTGIDLHRLHGEHLQRPEAAKADIAKAGRDMHEQPQPADRTAP